MKKYLYSSILALSFLVGCTSTGAGTMKGNGVEVSPPIGAVIYCDKYPTRKECGGAE